MQAYDLNHLPMEDSLSDYLLSVIEEYIKHHVGYKRIHIPDRSPVEFIQALPRMDFEGLIMTHGQNIQDTSCCFYTIPE